MNIVVELFVLVLVAFLVAFIVNVINDKGDSDGN